MDDKLEYYRQAKDSVPASHWMLPLYGQGFDNLGQNGRPIQSPVPDYGPDELLVRHDACGLCFSDVKVIRAGGGHPRLRGRDLQSDPVVMGHEVALTVVGVGAKLADQFSVGQRYLVQADVYYRGQNLAYGYALQGGLSQYNVLGDEVLRGDHGCYLIPVRPETGYAQAALTEPWACVEAAYNIHYRQGLRPGGVAWFLGAREDQAGDYEISRGFSKDGHPGTVILDDVPPEFAAWAKERAANLAVSVFERSGSASDEAYAQARAELAPSGVDDLVILGPVSPGRIAAAAAMLRRGGLLNIVGRVPLAGSVEVDVGRLHYDHMTVVGGTGPDIAASYQTVRCTLKPGGRLWVLGAAGPMGLMHIQRAIEMEPNPQLIVATNLGSPRISEVKEAFGVAAQAQGIDLVTMTEQDLGPEAFGARLQELTDGQGFNDIVVLAPDTETIRYAAAYLSPGGVMNLFVGLPRGTMARLDLNPVRDDRPVRFIGSSGSSIEDMRRMLDLTERGAISPERSVAAVAGLAGASDGLRAVSQGRFPGKVVIYPHIVELGLTPVADLEEGLPAVYACLKDGRTWTNAAEDQFLRGLL
jgi:threonine dehydrogenase-like Zn-dependent dehydrogenase